MYGKGEGFYGQPAVRYQNPTTLQQERGLWCFCVVSEFAFMWFKKHILFPNDHLALLLFKRSRAYQAHGKGNGPNIFCNLSFWRTVFKATFFFFHRFQMHIKTFCRWMFFKVTRGKKMPTTYLLSKKSQIWQITTATVYSIEIPKGNKKWTEKGRVKMIAQTCQAQNMPDMFQAQQRQIVSRRLATENAKTKIRKTRELSCSPFHVPLQKGCRMFRKQNIPHLVTRREVLQDSAPGVMWFQMLLLPTLIFQCLQLRRNLQKAFHFFPEYYVCLIASPQRIRKKKNPTCSVPTPIYKWCMSIYVCAVRFVWSQQAAILPTELWDPSRW